MHKLEVALLSRMPLRRRKCLICAGTLLNPSREIRRELLEEERCGKAAAVVL